MPWEWGREERMVGMGRQGGRVGGGKGDRQSRGSMVVVALKAKQKVPAMACSLSHPVRPNHNQTKPKLSN